MRFVCESCRAQYMINDEKVGPKGVKVRCRKCGYVILVKRTDAKGGPAAQSNDPDDGLATQVMQSPLTGPDATLDTAKDSNGKESDPIGDNFFGADEDEIGAVFDQVLKTGSNAAEPPAADQTRVIDGDSLRKLTEESGDRHEEEEEAPGEVPQTDWYVAINEVQTGPLTLEQIKKHWDEGEVGPDSLCWRAGFDDWIPVSTVKAFASILAPRPPKPVIVGPAATVTHDKQPAVVSVPVQSAFSSGGVMQTVQSEVQVPMAAASAATGADAGAWKPSAASALASLVKDEMEALAKPPPPPAPPEEEPPSALGGGLLDLPSEAPPQPSSPPARAPAPAAPPLNPYLQNPGATFSAPAVSQYRPPSNNMGLIVGVAGGAVVLLTLVGLIVWLATRQPAVVQPPPQPVVVAQPTPTPVPTPVPTPTPTPVPDQVAVAPSDTADAGVAVAVAAPPPETPAPTPVKVAAATKSTSSSSSSSKPPPKEREPAPEPAPKPKEREDFDSLFGVKSGGSTATPAKEEKKTASGGYVPPAPGGGAGVKASLENSDIIEGVSAHKPELAECVKKQKAADPSLSGKLVMKWTIKTNGTTANISVASEEFKGTPIATCIGGLIKKWTFPKHKQAMAEPVSFPFKF